MLMEKPWNHSCSFKKEELMQFYTGVDNPDFGFCYSYFRITDMQMMKSFIKSPVVTVEKVCNTVALNIKSEQTSELKIWASLKKLNYRKRLFLKLQKAMTKQQVRIKIMKRQ